MVTRVLKAGGLRDWMLQRVSAVVIAAYTLCLVGFWLLHASADFTVWHAFLAQGSMRLFSFLALLALLPHAWIGMWTVITDYLPSGWVQKLAQILVLLVLVSYAAWGVQQLF